MAAQDQLDDLVAVVPPLLQAVEALGHISRYLDPPRFDELMAEVGAPDQMLAAALPRLEAWPEELTPVRAALEAAAGHAIVAFERLRAAPQAEDGLTAIYRALRGAWRSQEALYPLSGALPPVSRFFVTPDLRQDEALLARLAGAPPREGVGLIHGGGEPGERGGFSMYVPEYYDETRAWPVVVALHGGAGDGRGFLWSWLRDARALGAIVVAPTAVGRTWSLNGPDLDSPNLERILGIVAERWRIDPSRLLLTGMSDGGTFAYVSGLVSGSPFSHLAPCSASFHPVLAQFADADRLTGLPIHICHGVRDWMFDVEVARVAEQTLSAAGANVTYLEIDDLAHTYPREINPRLLAWLDGASFETPA
jgi:phospholipase/carboxylesterase